jgi:putative PIN family toxin of toxin-antitoxin system
MKSIPEWVLDTNVVVSGLLSAQGPPGRLLDAVLARRLRMVVDDRIIREYRLVLARPKFSFDPEDLAQYWEIIPYQRHLSTIPETVLEAAEPEDTKFLELANATPDQILVTGNLKHFPRKGRGSVRVLRPAEALEILANI